MHRADWDGRRASAAMFLAWFVFDRAHDGSPPTVTWIRCGAEPGRHLPLKEEHA
jgi:hypothetical protein